MDYDKMCYGKTVPKGIISHRGHREHRGYNYL